MRKFYGHVAFGYFAVATMFLMLLALLLLARAVWEVVVALIDGDVLGVLRSAGLVIIGFAIIETAKFVAEEEILRDRELRSAVESRRSLTKFITIIVIAASLEALVMVFETSRTEITHAVYPAMLFAVSMLALVALGLYQWLSSRIAAPPPDPSGDSMDHQPTADQDVDGPVSRSAPRSGESGGRGKG